MGIPYLYDRKAIFYREHNTHHFFKDGIDFIVRVDQMKMNFIVVTTRHVKLLVNDSIQDSCLQPTVESKTNPLVDVVSINKGKYVDGSFSFTYVYSFLLFNMLLISGVWLVVATMNGEVLNLMEWLTWSIMLFQSSLLLW
jgi:hypothetical protein